MPLQDLPVELILRILEALDPPTLIVSRGTSRQFKSLIDEKATLQYRIALYASGMVDGPPGQLSTSERLSLLKSYEATWKNLQWNDHTSFPVPEGRLWELYGNVWAHSRGNKGIIFVQLPSRLRGIPMRRWTLDFDFTIRDFGIDPSQDLLVTVQSLHPEPCQIRLYTLSTGETHPLARSPATLEYTRIVPGHTIVSSYSIRVSADYVGILFLYHDDENELVVWNWKTGAKCLVAGSLDILSFTFLGHRFVLTSALEFVRPTLLLYDLDQSADRSRDYTDTHLLCFSFQTRWVGSVIHLTSDPSPEWSSSPELQVPFQTASDDQIIVLHRQRHHRELPSSETFLFPASALFEYVNDTPTEGRGRNIEWESWGPRCCDELVPGHGSWAVWQCFVFGMRYIFPRVEIFNDKWVLIVRDLCPRRYMRASDVEREESNALERVLGSQGSCSRSILKCVPIPQGIQALSGVHLMISEDGIVVLETDAINETRLLHLLTF